MYSGEGAWHERVAPRLSWPDALIAEAPAGALLCGEVGDELAAEVEQQRPDLRIVAGPAHVRRAVTLAALAWPRYAGGVRDSHLALEPIYLREPNITTKRKNAG